MVEQDYNISLQVEELEAINAIYNDEWKIISEASRTFQIIISDDENRANHIIFQVTLPDTYPKSSPPNYTLCAPWLTPDLERNMILSLNNVCRENQGESVIYLLIEKTRELFCSVKGDLFTNYTSSEESSHKIDSLHSEEKNPGKGDVADDYSTNYEDYVEETVLFKQQRDKSISKHNMAQNGSNSECPEIFSGESVFDRRSEFVGHIAIVYSEKQARLVLDKLKENKKIAAATHNIYAFRIVRDCKYINSDCDDDGEFGAGSRLLHLLNIMNAENVIVVVTRWYGGVHLGGDRFKHINNCARSLLESHGFAKDKQDGNKKNKSNESTNLSVQKKNKNK